MNNQSTPHTLQDALDYAAAAGVPITAADYRKISELQIEAEKLIEVLPATWVDRFNRFYPKFLNFLVGSAEILITTSQTIIVAFGAPLVLVLLLIVEHSRVKFGIGLFESEAALASFASWAMVILNTVLEFTIHYQEHRMGYTPERALQPSLRLYSGKIAYWLGMGKHWRPIELSPAIRYKRLQRLVTFTILALATAGSMREVIASQSGAWHQALIAIATDSTLSQMSTWVGGLLFAVAAVLSAQIITAYLAIRSREIVDKMATDNQALSAADRAAVQYIMAKVAAKTGVNEPMTSIDEKEADFLALVPTLITPNGKNGHH